MALRTDLRKSNSISKLDQGNFLIWELKTTIKDLITLTTEINHLFPVSLFIAARLAFQGHLLLAKKLGISCLADTQNMNQGHTGLPILKPK